MREKIILIAVLLLILFSCKEETNPIAGPCVHTYKEPILNITAVKDTVNNTPINFVTLKNIKVNGEVQYGAHVFVTSYSIVADDSVFYCNIPFGFGVITGKYEFTIEAEGFNPQHVIINNVKYSDSKGGCPSYSDGGKRIQIYLEKK